MRYRFILEHEKAWPVKVMCEVLGVSRSGYYDWKPRRECSRARENRRLTVKIKAIHKESRQTYGSPRVHAVLKEEGYRCGKNRVSRLMANEGIRSKVARKFKVTTDSGHRFPVAENFLKRKFEVAEANRVWLADITYIWTHEGWLYLAVVLDLFSRRVVGWSTSKRIDRELVCKALKMAYLRRRPSRGLIHHSDRGSQYASLEYQRLLKDWGIQCSMSRKGDCWDNAPMESFFHTLKGELVHHQNYLSRSQAKREVLEYLEIFYNGKRKHSALGYKSPMEFETMPLVAVA